MSLPQGLLGLLLSIITASYIGAVLYYFGGRRVRSWAVPVAAAILFGGAGHSYNLPDWAVIGGVLVAPLIFHRTVRRRLEKAARKLERLELSEPRMTLRRIPDYSGRHVCVWSSALQGPPKAQIDRSPLIISLDFVGEVEDEYQVIVWSETTKHLPGELVLYWDGALGLFTEILAAEPRISGVPGISENWVLRTLPDDYGFRLINTATAEILRKIFDLRGEEREIYVHIKGQAMRIVATSTYTEWDLRRLIPLAALLFLRVRGES